MKLILSVLYWPDVEETSGRFEVSNFEDSKWFEHGSSPSSDIVESFYEKAHDALLAERGSAKQLFVEVEIKDSEMLKLVQPTFTNLGIKKIQQVPDSLLAKKVRRSKK